jgi:hypothetical protein
MGRNSKKVTKTFISPDGGEKNNGSWIIPLGKIGLCWRH